MSQYTSIASLEQAEPEIHTESVCVEPNDEHLIDAIIDQLNGDQHESSVIGTIDDDPVPHEVESVTTRPSQPKQVKCSVKLPLCSSSDDIWSVIMSILKEPFIVGIVVVLLSSKRIQVRLMEFIPAIVSDNFQGAIVRLVAGMAMYLLIQRLL